MNPSYPLVLAGVLLTTPALTAPTAPPELPPAEPLPVVPGLNVDYLDGLDSSAFAAAGHDHDAAYYTKHEVDARFDQRARIHIATLPRTTTEGTCDGDWHPFPTLALVIEADSPTVLDVSSGVNAVITGQTQTGVRIDGVFDEHSMDIFNVDGRVTFNAGWAAEVGPGTHTVELLHRCLATALFDNSGRLVVRLL